MTGFTYERKQPIKERLEATSSITVDLLRAHDLRSCPRMFEKITQPGLIVIIAIIVITGKVDKGVDVSAKNLQVLPETAAEFPQSKNNEI